MARLTTEHAPTLEALRGAAGRKADADADLKRLIGDALQAGVPAIHVAEAAGISRPTLYRLLGRKVEP
jgi:AcrR family transcriptional regulator